MTDPTLGDRPIVSARQRRNLRICLLGPLADMAPIAACLTELGHRVHVATQAPETSGQFDVAVIEQTGLAAFFESSLADRVPHLEVLAPGEDRESAALHHVAGDASPREWQLALHLAIADWRAMPASPSDLELEEPARFLDLLVDPAYLLDAQARLYYVNPAACRAHGWPREVLLKKRVFDFDPTVERENWHRIWQQTVENAGGTFESVHLTADGKSYPVEITASPIRHQGRLFVFSFARNISERQQAQAALCRQREQARRYLDIAGTMLVALDAEARITRANKKACQVLGYRNEEQLLGRHWFSTVIPVSEREAVVGIFRQLMSGDVAPVEHHTNRVLTRRGETRLVQWHNSVLPDETGRVHGVLSSGEDITEQQAAKRLLERQAALNNLLTAVSRDLFSAEPQALDEAIGRALGQFGDHCRLDSAFRLCFDREAERFRETHTWVARSPGGDAGAGYFLLDDTAALPDWLEHMRNDRPVVIADAELSGEAEGAELRLLRERAIRALVAVPVIGPSGLNSCIGFGKMTEPRDWGDEEIRILRLLGDLVSLVLRNRQSLQRLQTSEYRWKFALEGSGQGVWDWNARTNRVYYSPLWKRMLGYQENEIGPDLEEWSRRVHPDDLPGTMASIQAHLEGNDPIYRSEHRIRHRDGEYRWVLDRGMVVARDADGAALRVIGTHTDVTEQHENRRRLMESTAQLEAIFTNSQVGIMLLTGYRIMARCNQRLADITGYPSPERMLGMSMRQLHLSEENFTDFGRRYYDNLRERQMLHIEYQLRRKDGRAIWCLLSGKALDAAQPPDLDKGVIWVVDDISHIKQTERELREQRDLFSGGPTMVFQWQPGEGWPVDFCSANVQDILGFAPARLMGGDIQFASLVHPHDLPVISEEVAGYLASGKDNFEQEYRLRHADGRYLTFYDYTHLQRDDRGGVSSIYGYLLDITQQRDTERERLRMERELQQTRKMEALGQLTGGVAHEFNNMLAIILGHAGLLRSRLGGQADPRIEGYLNHIDQAGSRAKALIRQMLSFSRPQENRPERIALEPAIHEMIILARGSLPSSIEISYRPVSGLPDVLLDMGELQQLLTNLLINARDAMDGKGHVEVGLQRYQGLDGECLHCHTRIRGQWVQLSVADDGQGIAREHLARLFEPFFSTKEVGKGTGLGLSVVLGIMERNGGHILVDSEPGAGALFRLLFPPLGPPEDVQPPVPEPEHGVPSLSGRVLVVDDEPALTAYLRELLRGRGLDVTVSNDSREALGLLTASDKSFDLLITDQTMPGLLGTELSARARGRRPQLKTLLCTGHSEQVDAGLAAAQGIDRFMLKPVDADELLRVVQELLGTEADKYSVTS